MAMGANATGGFVLDCSVTMAWCFEDEATAYTNRVRDTLMNTSPVVPSLWRLEVANTLLVGERRKKLDKARSARFLTLLDALPITIDDTMDNVSWREIIHLGRTHRLCASDSAYLEIAIRHGLPLATLDKQLRTAAKAAGVSIWLN